jgi:hypothetical protein
MSADILDALGMGDLDEFLCKISTESLSANLYWL